MKWNHKETRCRNQKLTPFYIQAITFRHKKDNLNEVNQTYKRRKVQTIPKKRYLRFGYYLRGPQDLTPFPHKMKYRAVIPPLMTEGITCKTRNITSSISQNHITGCNQFLVLMKNLKMKYFLSTWVFDSGLPFQGFCITKNRIHAGTRQLKIKRTTEAPVCDKYRYIE